MNQSNRVLWVSIVVFDLDMDILSQCLHSLVTALDSAVQAQLLSSWKILILDNGNNQDALSQLAQVTLIHNKQNLGYGSAHNVAIGRSDAEFHLILNPDVILEPQCINASIRTLDADACIAAIGANGSDPSGNDACLSKRYPTVLDLLLRGFAPELVKKFFSARLAHYEYRDIIDVTQREVELLSGCYIFARTRLLQKINAFDARFFLYFEDFDLSIRLAEVGKVIYSPTVRLIHFGGNSARKGRVHIWYFVRSAVRFYQKHGWRLW